jgi:hypothetical protein
MVTQLTVVPDSKALHGPLNVDFNNQLVSLKHGNTLSMHRAMSEIV